MPSSDHEKYFLELLRISRSTCPGCCQEYFVGAHKGWGLLIRLWQGCRTITPKLWSCLLFVVLGREYCNRLPHSLVCPLHTQINEKLEELECFCRAAETQRKAFLSSRNRVQGISLSDKSSSEAVLCALCVPAVNGHGVSAIPGHKGLHATPPLLAL